MKTSVERYEFIQAFKNMNREDNFSRDGLIALYEYLEEYEESTDEEYELDVIALCCDFTEYSDLEEFQAEHDSSGYPEDNYPDFEAISEFTQLIPVGINGLIIQNF